MWDPLTSQGPTALHRLSAEWGVGLSMVLLPSKESRPRTALTPQLGVALTGARPSAIFGLAKGLWTKNR